VFMGGGGGGGAGAGGGGGGVFVHPNSTMMAAQDLHCRFLKANVNTINQ
jgi:hypothetical protein